MTLGHGEVLKLLQAATDAKGSRRFFDVHVHPFDVVLEEFGYRPDPTRPGVFRLGDAPYSPMQVGPVRIGPPLASESLRPGVLLLRQRCLYGHSGPAVVRHQMSLAGIDRALLLPVAPRVGAGETQMDMLAALFGEDPSFALATSVPNSVATARIGEFVAEAVRRYRVAAVKLHPPITAIDLGSGIGRDRTDAILDACDRGRLPLIVHGGISRLVRDSQAALYGSIDRLKKIRWRTARVPVVIAHAGCYGCSLHEIEKDVLPTLEAMLSANENLFIDISTLEHDALVLILPRVDLDRVLFGSDAFYDSAWSTMVKLMSALRTCRMEIDEALVAIASSNPSRSVFAGDQWPND
jgi:predicted TIM-barrel fold metal-dependent hydrolase